MSLIEEIEQFVKDKLGEESTGHDYLHADRVRKLALHIAIKEGGDKELIELAALIHDLIDSKIKNYEENENKLKLLLNKYFSKEKIEQLFFIIKNISYKGDENETFDNQEWKVVQDADKLDALGAIGVARAFAVGSKIYNRPLYDPDVKPKEFLSKEQYKKYKGPTINHFYEKLLKLKDKMNTETARKIAEKRHKFMEAYLEQFYKELELKE